jgi:hypothetical protein
MSWLRTKLESFAMAEISSRPLGLFRIFAAFILIYQFAGPWVSYQVDKFPVAMVTVWVFFISAFVVMVGYKTRLATIILALSFAILQLYYGVHHDIYKFAKPVQQFQVTVLMALAPCGRSMSVDRALEVRRAAREGREPAPERVPWWMVEMFILQIAVVYFWAAENKSDDKWFRGERMERYWVEWYGTSDSLAHSKLVHPIAVFFAYATTLLEYVLAFGLPIRRFRPYLLWGGIILHLGILATVAVTYFSFMMILILLLCVPPQWIHDFVSRLIEDSEPAATAG